MTQIFVLFVVQSSIFAVSCKADSYESAFTVL